MGVFLGTFISGKISGYATRMYLTAVPDNPVRRLVSGEWGRGTPPIPVFKPDKSFGL